MSLFGRKKQINSGDKGGCEQTANSAALKNGEGLNKKCEPQGRNFTADKPNYSQEELIKHDSLLKENAELRLKAQTLCEINQKQSEEIKRLNAQIEIAGAKFDESESVTARSAEIIKEAETRAEEIKNAAALRYALEIRRVKALAVCAEAELKQSGGEQNKKKAALVMALKEILNFDETRLNGDALSEKAEELTDFIRGGKREEEGAIDLEEVLAPKEELDLEALCRELGVME